MALGAKKKEQEPKILDVNASMQGELIFSDPVNLRINGSFQGKLNTKGKLIIGEKASVKADIVGENITIAGKVEGTIFAETKLKLEPGANLSGDIKTPLLVVEEGAIINGRCTMQSRSKYSKEVLGLEEMASYLQIDKETLLSWAEQGKVPCFKENNLWKFDRRKVDEWLTKEKVYK
jgi:excisionase family DNA binding protein